MSSVQGHTIFTMPARARQTQVHKPFANALLGKYKISSGLWGLKAVTCGNTNAGNRLQLHNVKLVKCSFSSSSDGNGSMAENSDENTAEYVYCSVTDAVAVESSPDGFMIKMINGRLLRCAHNNPQAENLPDYPPHPAIVLKMEDGTGLLLPVLAMEMESALLIVALKNAEVARPSIYGDMLKMIHKMGYMAKLVRITKRVHEGFYSRLYLTKLGDGTENITFDLRPADAINIAVRCKVPIQVNKNLAYREGMRVIETSSIFHGPIPVGAVSRKSELDRPSGQPCPESKEFELLSNMSIAVSEERYEDAAVWRDKLFQLWSNKDSA